MYHVNDKGESKICHAKIEENCDFFERSPHFNTKEEAQAWYESSNDSFSSPSRKRIEIKPNGYLTDTEAKKVAIHGVSCPSCGEPISAMALAILLYDVTSTCKKCSHEYYLEEAKIEILPDNPSYQFLDKEAVKGSSWFHATSLEDWNKSDEEHIAHLGTKNAAFDRALTEYVDRSEPDSGFYLYEVELSEDAVVSDDVEEDENSDALSTESSDDVARYINRWEDTASISLEVKSSKIRIKNKRFVRNDEAMRTHSVYNLDTFGLL